MWARRLIDTLVAKQQLVAVAKPVIAVRLLA